MSDKPAMNTLKKTFTAMLSRIGGGRVLGGAGAGDTSGSDNISVNSRCVQCGHLAYLFIEVYSSTC